MPSERLEIARHAIAKLIKDGSLCVPRNQREYAWKPEHIIDLYQDIEKAIADGAPDYFLGSVVVARTDGKLEVFDGQQRLATSVIFLAAIRDRYTENGDQERAGIIEKEYLLSKNLETLEAEPKLCLSKSDHDFYLKRILANDAAERASVQPNAESHERINDAADIAAKHVKDIVAALPTASKGQALNTRVAYLTERAMVICVEVPDKRSAYVVFETMNDRGLRPSAADLLKNHLFGLADNRIDEAERNWVAMTGALETIPDADDDIVVTYIRHFWTAQHGLARSKELFDKIQDEIKTKQPAIDFTAELATNASLYSALLNPAHDMWNQYGPTAKKHLQTICGLRVEQLRPLLLAAVKKFPKNEMTRFLLTALCWSVRCLIVGIGGGALEANYSRSAQRISRGEITTVDQLATAMAGIIPADDVFRTSASVARVAKADLGRYYLRALQLKADRESEPQYVPNDSGEINLEHILPQSPSAAWMLNADEMKANFRRLGNLVLLQATENSLADNDDYATKKPILARSDFSLTREASAYDQWTPTEINTRQSRLATLAVDTWPLRP